MIPRNFVLLFPVTYTLKGILANNILHKEAKKTQLRRFGSFSAAPGEFSGRDA